MVTVALFAIWNNALDRAERSHRVAVANCQRANVLRNVLSVVAESQLNDLAAASRLATSPALRAQYRVQVDRMHDLLDRQTVQANLRQVDCKHM